LVKFVLCNFIDLSNAQALHTKEAHCEKAYLKKLLSMKQIKNFTNTQKIALGL